MQTIEFVPGAIVSGNPLTIPTPAPDIYAVVTASITRLPTALGVQDHPAVDVVAGFGDHPALDVVAGFGDHPAADIVAGFADHGAAAVIAGVIDHPQADIAAALGDHAVHAHDLLVTIAAVGEAYGASVAGATDLESATGQTVPGASASGGVQDIAAAQAHAPAVAVAHSVGVALVHVVGLAVAHVAGVDVAHVAGVDVAHGAAADPVVAAVPTIATTRTLTLDVNTLLGDLVTLHYLEVGEFVRAS